ncbi:MAG TPA: class I SAM-dependent methyltransferase [Nitrospirota bacterium]|nr:class I SAM-dependent methyltransferase [Nitrospirota bacterium]
MNQSEGCQNALATAHQAWDSLWGTEAGRKDWIAAEQEVRDLEKELAGMKVSRVLDVGCGIGRHSLFFASNGFQVFSIDASSKAVDFTQKAAQEAGLSLTVRQSPMTTLPFENGYFDYVLAWNVIYHGDPTTVRTVLSEIARVLRPGGLFQGTMLTKRNAYYGKGKKVAPDTYVNDEEDEKRHAHFYCNAKELAELLHDFEILSLSQKRQLKPGSYHWHYVAERL